MRLLDKYGGESLFDKQWFRTGYLVSMAGRSSPWDFIGSVLWARLGNRLQVDLELEDV